MTIDFSAYLHDQKTFLDQHLIASIEDPPIPETLRNAMCYSLEAGGKRIRPILAIAGAQAVGGHRDQILPFALALEMIHTFSLIHDDLPAMDNDDVRRGKPTNHKVFGEAMAILAGDALVAEAFWLMARPLNGIPSELLVSAIRDLADASGARGMTGGQVIDMEATGKKIDEQALEHLHRHKTGKLLSLAVVIGAKLCGATKQQLTALRCYGDAVGLAFQIADDILDVEGTTAELGKDAGSDVDNGKSTYPEVIGIEAAKKREKMLIDEAVTALEIFDERADPLRAIARYIIERRT